VRQADHARRVTLSRDRGFATLGSHRAGEGIRLRSSFDPTEETAVHRTTSHVALAFLLTSVAAAQRTWVVDSMGGIGSHFTDLPPAIAAAARGDTILVRR
jgi:hypothetical protein